MIQHVRKARFEDADAILAVRRDAIMGIASECGVDGASRWAGSAPASYAIDAIGTNDVFVVESESGIVGWVAFRANKVENLYVRKSAGRSRVGTVLMARAEAVIATSHSSEVVLDASPNAVAFYRKLGYFVVAGPKADTSLPMAKPIVRGR
jgi:predicted N-acetyltransferase YhbS